MVPLAASSDPGETPAPAPDKVPAGAIAVINSIVSKIGILDSFGKNVKDCPVSDSRSSPACQADELQMR